jgi:ABC-type multidrug transport system fused ATPase/permease subunit
MAKRHSANTDNIDEKRKLKRGDFQKALQIYSFVLPYKWRLLVGVVFLVISTVTSLAIPVLAGKFLDVATGKVTDLFSSIPQVGMIFALILMLQATVSFFRIYLFAQVSEQAMADVRTTLYQKIISLPITFFEQKRVGELNSRITSDVTQLQDALSFTIAEFFRQIMTILIGTTYLFIQSTQLTLFMVATFPVLILMAIFFGRFIRKMAKKAQDELAKSNVIVEETFQAIHAVKAFTNEWFEINRYQKSLQEVVKTTLKTARYRGLFASFVIALLFGGLVLVLAYGAQLVAQKQMSVGELTTFIIFSAFIGGSLGGTSEMYGQLQKTIGASERILEILNEQSEVNIQTQTIDHSPQTINNSTIQQFSNLTIKGSVEFQGVRFAYPTRPDVEVLKGIDFQIGVGQKIALVGYSGAGKSTVVQLLNRFYSLTEGIIRVDNTDIQQIDITHLRRHIGIVPQEVMLFGGTIQENIAYGKPTATEAEIIAAAKQANAWSFIAGFPEGLQTIVGERGVKLSGGQRQRIAIARAILKNPAILILDEATSSLDAESEQLVQEALDTLMENRTTIIIAHRLATVRKADRIYVINEGRIVESGTHEELALMDEGIYSNLVKLQFEVQES